MAPLKSTSADKTKNAKPSSIAGWRKRLTAFEQELIDEVWQEFLNTGTWPMFRVLFSRYGKQKVEQALTHLTDAVGWDENGSGRWKHYRLTLLGVLLTSEGETLQNLLVGFFEFQRYLFNEQPHESYSQHSEIAKYLGLSSAETSTLGLLLAFGSLGGSSEGAETWGASAMDEASEFPAQGNLFKEFERWLLGRYSNPLRTTNSFLNRRSFEDNFLPGMVGYPSVSQDPHPPEINASLRRLRQQFPDSSKLGFLVMRFSDVKPMKAIVKAIKQAGRKLGITILRADENPFHSELWGNVRTLLHGCSFGIAIYERIETNEPNANVGLEVGYLMAMNKPVLLLKDRTVSALHSDIAGKLYVEFDTHSPQISIPKALESWLIANGIVVK